MHRKLERCKQTDSRLRNRTQHVQNDVTISALKSGGIEDLAMPPFSSQADVLIGKNTKQHVSLQYISEMQTITVGPACLTYCDRDINGDHKQGKWVISRACYLAWITEEHNRHFSTSDEFHFGLVLSSNLKHTVMTFFVIFNPSMRIKDEDNH